MLKKLRLKFVLINMSIVTIMLCVILGLVFYFTSANLEAASINMMQNIAANPLHLGFPMRERRIFACLILRSNWDCAVSALLPAAAITTYLTRIFWMIL